MTPIVFLRRKSSLDKSIYIPEFSEVSDPLESIKLELLVFSIFDYWLGTWGELYDNSKNHNLSHNRIINRLSDKVAMALTIS